MTYEEAVERLEEALEAASCAFDAGVVEAYSRRAAVWLAYAEHLWAKDHSGRVVEVRVVRAESAGIPKASRSTEEPPFGPPVRYLVPCRHEPYRDDRQDAYVLRCRKCPSMVAAPPRPIYSEPMRLPTWYVDSETP